MNCMEGLLKQIPGRPSRSFWLGTWSGAREVAFLTGSRAMLLVLCPHFENHGFKSVDNYKEHLLTHRRPLAMRKLMAF